jgi:hypothetical protein
MIEITTPRCTECGKASTVELTPDEWRALTAPVNGRMLLIQQALPNRDAAFRELVKSGIHDACWQAMFPDPDDEDEDDEDDELTREEYLEAYPHDEHVGLDEPGGYGS